MTGSLGEVACLFFGFDAACEPSIIDDFHRWLEARFLYRTEYGFIYYAWREVFPDRDQENFLHLPSADQDLVFDKVLELAESFTDDRLSERADTGPLGAMGCTEE